MTATATITGAKAGNKIKPAEQSLSQGALNSIFSFAGDNLADKRLLEQVINMPVELFILTQVAVQP